MEDSPAPKKIQVKVGWALPDNDMLVMNFHFSSMLHSWKEVVPVPALVELHEMATAEKVSILEASFPSQIVTEGDKLASLLNREAKWNGNNTDTLVNVSQKMETWIEQLLLMLPTLPSPLAQLLKQLFFRSVNKIQVFELLVSKRNSLKAAAPVARPRVQKVQSRFF